MKVEKTVLITGAAKRLGRDMAVHLSDCGFTLALHYNQSGTQAEKTAKAIAQRGGICKIFPADLSKKDEVENLIPSVLKAFKRLDVLINNASVFKPSRLTDSLDVFDQHFDTNCKAPYILMREFALKCKRGHIINILDTHITKNDTKHFAYLLSKKALFELTKMSAVALAPHIRVNGIAPGLVLPPEGRGTSYLNRLAKDIPLKKRGYPKDISQALSFLMNNNYVTGQILFSDGGEHLNEAAHPYYIEKG